MKNLKAVNETLIEKYLQYLHYSDIGDLSELLFYNKFLCAN